MRTMFGDREGYVMATESNSNAIADFDIDEVIDWDKHDIPSKDIEFDELQGLNVQASNVTSSATQASSTSSSLNSSGRDGLVLGSQLLAPPHREPGAAIVSMPQVSQRSAINPVFPGDPNSLIRDIRQEYLHAQSLAARSRTPPTPTFPSENFDLPPITPPGSIHSAFPVGQQPLRMALMSNLNRPATVQSQLPSFVTPNLPPTMGNVSMSQQLQPVVGEPLVEGSNIEELIDEIVERDMPQGVSEPIVFAPHVSQQPNPAQAHLQISSNALQKAISPVSVQTPSQGQLVTVPTNATGKPQLPMGVVVGGSPLNTPGSPGSPLTSSRSPSPNVKQTNHTGKISTPMRSANQTMRLTQPGSPLQNPPQSTVKSTRSLPTNSQMLQMAVPSAVASAKSQTGSSQPRTPGNLQVKNSVEAATVNPQAPRVTLAASTVQTIASQVQGQSIAGFSNCQAPRVTLAASAVQTNAPQSRAQSTAGSSNPQAPRVTLAASTGQMIAPQIQGQSIAVSSNKASLPKVLQGSNVSAISIQSSGKPIQSIPLQTLASNPELLGQLVKAIGQPNAKQQGSTANVQTGQPLICYVVPQNSATGTQTKSSVPLSSSSHPVKMILVNANSPVKLPVQPNTQQAKSATTIPANSGLNCLSLSSSSQTADTKIELERGALNPSFKKVLTSAETGKISVVSGVKSDAIVTGNIPSPSVQLSAGVKNYQMPMSVPTAMQQGSPRFLINNPNGKQNSSQSNNVPSLQTPLSSSGNVVQITFVNEATAISQVVAASSATLSSSYSSGSQNMVAASQSSGMMPSSLLPSSPSSSHVLAAPIEPATSADQQDSDEDDDDDSKPLSQVAENLKKVGIIDDVKKKKKKKKDKDKEKGTKRKRKEKGSQALNKPLTAYELFFKETQAAVRTKNPMAQFEDIKKIVDQMWETLSENLKKTFQEKAQQEEDLYRAKKLSQQDEPSPKLKKVEAADAATAPSTTAAPVAVEESRDNVPIAGNKPLSHAPSQAAMAGKPVATVTPMATTKTTSNSNNQPTVPAKPKKSKITVNPISQRLCLCDGCNKPARTTKERGTQYCSNECIVKHCRLAFTVWVTQRNEKSGANS